MNKHLTAEVNAALEAYRQTGYTMGGTAVGLMYDILQNHGWTLVAEDLVTRWAADHTPENTRRLVASLPFQVAMLQSVN